SLGAILYELLTGRPPFRSSNTMATLLQVMEQEPVRPRLLRPGTDADLETICLKCLEKEPARRYGSAESLARDLERWLAGEPIQARSSTRLERLLKWARRRPAAAALLGVSTLAALAIVVLSGLLYKGRLEQAEAEAEAQTKLAERERQDSAA